MKLVKKADVVTKQNSSTCHVTEYPMHDQDINIAIATITGRYPESGWVINTVCKEIGLVIEGSGRLVTEHRVVDLTDGDAVLIESGEKYYWDGNMTLILPVTPAWYAEQHQNSF